MTDETANVTLRLALDQQAASQSQSAVKALNDELSSTKTTASSAGDVSDQSLKTITSGAVTATDEVAKLRDEITKTADAAKQVNAGGSGGLFDVSSLRTTGRALDQLGLKEIGKPLQQLGDVGKITDQLGELAKKFQDLPPIIGDVTEGSAGLAGGLGTVLAIAGPLALAIAAVALAVKLFSDAMDQQAAAEKRALDIKAQTAAAAQNDTSTQINTDMAKQQTIIAEQTAVRIQAEKDMAAASGQSLESVQKFTDSLKGLSTTGADVAADVKGSGLGVSAAVRLQGGTFQAAADEWAKAQAAIDKATDSQTALANASSTATVKTNDLYDATVKHIDLQDKLTATYAADDQLTSKAAQNKSDALKAEITSQQDSIEQLKKASATLPPYSEALDKANQEIQKHQDIIDQDTAEVQHLTNTSMDLIKAREAEDQAAKDQAKSQQALASAYEKNEKAVESIQQSGADQKVSIETKYEDSVSKIKDQGIQTRLKLENDYSVKLIDIARQAAQTAQDEYTKLQQKLADDQRTLDRAEQDIDLKDVQDRQKLQLDSARQEAKDLQDHLRNLEDIRRNALAGEEADLYNRNFTALLTARQSANQRIQDENTRFVRQQQDQQTADAQKLQDEQIAIAQERQARLTAYERANEDAQTNYDRQREQQQLDETRKEKDAQIARDRALQAQSDAEDQALQVAYQGEQNQLTLLSQSITNKLKIQAEGYQEELKLALQTSQQRLQIVQAEAQAAQAAIGSTNTSTLTPTVSTPLTSYFAASGGQVIVNDGYPGQRESFNGVRFPPGLGTFIPARSGTISDSGSNITINVNGAQDPEMVSRKVVEIIKRVQKVS